MSCEILTADIETILESVFGRNPNNLRKHDTESDYSGSKNIVSHILNIIEADHHEDEEHSGEDHSGDRDIELEQNETEVKIQKRGSCDILSILEERRAFSRRKRKRKGSSSI